jgi:hypothetical protein
VSYVSSFFGSLVAANASCVSSGLGRVSSSPACRKTALGAACGRVVDCVDRLHGLLVCGEVAFDALVLGELAHVAREARHERHEDEGVHAPFDRREDPAQ